MAGVKAKGVSVLALFFVFDSSFAHLKLMIGSWYDHAIGIQMALMSLGCPLSVTETAVIRLILADLVKRA